MRLASVSGRATLLVTTDGPTGLRGVDVAVASKGMFGPDMMSIYPRWEAFREWVASVDVAGGDPIDTADLGNPAPAPTQVFAAGLNYYDHAAETSMPDTREGVPLTFTKFQTSLADPFAPLVLPSTKIDWEAELVAVIGRQADRVTPADAWSCVAGLAVGQDYSERDVQLAGPMPQFSLGKSYAGFGPIGPWLVSPDEFANPNDLEVVCEVNGEPVQKGRTSRMIWPLPDIISSLSSICTLLPGDVIFTGTPAGVGAYHSPPRFLSPGDVVVSRIEGIGEIRQTCVAAAV